ncbi:MAG: hypothetical protein ACM3S2_00585 [Ignavibacteriales bacterium]
MRINILRLWVVLSFLVCLMAAGSMAQEKNKKEEQKTEEKEGRDSRIKEDRDNMKGGTRDSVKTRRKGSAKLPDVKITSRESLRAVRRSGTRVS